MSDTTKILRSMVPKCCRTVNGVRKGGFIDWKSKEGRAVNEALLALALVDELKELGYCHNYQQERSYLVEWIDSVNQIIKDIEKVAPDTNVGYKRWIPVGYERPCRTINGCNMPVLTLDRNREMAVMDYNFITEKFVFLDKDCTDSVVYWMLLPEPL